MKRAHEKPGELVFTSLLAIISDCKSYRSGWHARQRDMSTLIERYACEGRGFLMHRLSGLGKSLDKALSAREPLSCDGFCVKPGTCLPAFLYDLFEQVFNAEDGFVLPPSEVNALALRELRQVLFYAYKEEFPFTRVHQAAAVQKLRTVDDSLPGDDHVVSTGTQRVLEFAALLVGDLFRGIDPHDIVPGHGPGAVATKEKPFEKMDFRRIYTSVAKEYPYQRYFTLGWHHLNCDDGHYGELQRIPEPTSRMALVPKDARGPRAISMEPLEVQWIQQGLKGLLYDWIEAHPLTKGHVNFTNQEINRTLALKSSADQQFDTVDLKDASNRNSVWLVKQVWKYSTTLLSCLLATRSTMMELLDGSTIRLKMFAPMGSAVCFPVQAIVYWALSVSCLVVKCKLPFALARRVWVFGDDIILPHGYIEELMEVFNAVGLEINLDKSCSNGFFRESCGMDAFNGNDVTPCKIRKSPPSTQHSAANIVSWVERGNMLDSLGYPQAARLIFDHIEGLVGKLPIIPLDDPEVGFLHRRARCASATFSRKTRLRWVPCQQTWMAELWTWKGKEILTCPRRNWSALMQVLTKPSGGVRNDRSDGLLLDFNCPEGATTDRFALPKALRLSKTWVHLHGMVVAVSV